MSAEIARTPAPRHSGDPVEVVTVVPVVSPDPAKASYKVRPGDSLYKICKDKMRDTSQASVNKLYNANKGTLRSPSALQPGMTLVIPT